MVQLHRQWNSGLVLCSGRSFWPQLSGNDTPVAAISIHTNMNVEGQPENFHLQALQSVESAAGSSAEGDAAAVSPMSFSSGTNLGLTYVSAAKAAQFTAKASAGAAPARGGRNTELQSKGRHSGNSFRLEPGNCRQLRNPHVMTAYSKWAANQSTAKKAPFWDFFEELKKAGRSYPQVWMCVGCHPAGDAALTLYEHVYMGQQFDKLESTFLFEVYIKRISSNHVLKDFR